MISILAIMKKDILQWTRRPLYFISSVILAVLIIAAVGSTLSGARHLPFGIYDPDDVGSLEQRIARQARLRPVVFDDLHKARESLAKGEIVALAEVESGLLEDTVNIVTDGFNPLIEDQISMGVLRALSSGDGEMKLPIRSSSLFLVDYDLQDYMTPGLVAYLCFVLACMNVGFSWIYEWMERTYRQIILAPDGLRSAVIAKTMTVTVEASVVLWLALSLTSPLVGYRLGGNFLGLVGVTLLSMFCFTCLGLAVACFLRTIRIYTMTISIAGVAIMFASGIILPLEGMPLWQQQIARVFPLFYATDAFRGIMLDIPADYALDALVLLGWSAVALLLSLLMLKRKQAAL